MKEISQYSDIELQEIVSDTFNMLEEDTGNIIDTTRYEDACSELEKRGYEIVIDETVQFYRLSKLENK